MVDSTKFKIRECFDVGIKVIFGRLTEDTALKHEFLNEAMDTAQKMKFSINDFFSKCDQIHVKLWFWAHLLKRSSMEKLIFCVVGSSYLNILHFFFWKKETLERYY